MMKLKAQKGFTLTELLIVMAVIVVLAAVAVPTFGKQLETARETGDMEIIRNAYTEALSQAVLDGADGKLNGVIGNADAASDTNTTWGSGLFSLKFVEVAGSTTNGKYEVTVGANTFSQAPPQTTTSGRTTVTNNTSEKFWKYVSPKLMDNTVPPVSSNTEKVTFEFEISASDGSVKLVTDTPASGSGKTAKSAVLAITATDAST